MSDNREKLNDLKYVSKEEYNSTISDIKTKLELLGKDFTTFTNSFKELREVVQQMTQTMQAIVYQDKVLKDHEDRLDKQDKKIDSIESRYNRTVMDKTIWFWRVVYVSVIFFLLEVLKSLFGWNIDLTKFIHLFLR